MRLREDSKRNDPNNQPDLVFCFCWKRNREKVKAKVLNYFREVFFFFVFAALRFRRETSLWFPTKCKILLQIERFYVCVFFFVIHPLMRSPNFCRSANNDSCYKKKKKNVNIFFSFFMLVLRRYKRVESVRIVRVALRSSRALWLDDRIDTSQ